MLFGQDILFFHNFFMNALVVFSSLLVNLVLQFVNDLHERLFGLLVRRFHVLGYDFTQLSELDIIMDYVQGIFFYELSVLLENLFLLLTPVIHRLELLYTAFGRINGLFNTILLFILFFCVCFHQFFR